MSSGASKRQGDLKVVEVNVVHMPGASPVTTIRRSHRVCVYSSDRACPWHAATRLLNSPV